MIDALNTLVQTLGALALVLSVLVLLILALRKPVRTWLGAVAAYNLWLLMVLWVPLYVVGTWLAPWLRMPQPALTTTPAGNVLHIDWSSLTLPAIGFDAGATDGANSHWLWPAVLVVWALGCAALLVWQGIRLWCFVLHVLQQAQPVYNREWEVIVGRNVPVVSLPGMSSAALFGVSSPTLLLPEAFDQLHDADQQHIILSHEAVHLRRNDNLWNCGASVVLALFWWNPLLWWAWRCYRFDQELSCDALALTACNQVQQKRYARTLLDAISELPGLGQHPALTAWGDLAQLQERTLMVARHLRIRARPTTVMAWLLGIAVAGVGLTLTLSTVLAPPAAPDRGIRVRLETPALAPGVMNNPVQLQLVEKQTTGEINRPAPEQRMPVSRELGQQLMRLQQLIAAKELDQVQQLLSELEQQIDSGALSAHEQLVIRQFQIQLNLQKQDYAGARAVIERLLAGNGMNAMERSSMEYMRAQTFMQEEKWQQAADALAQWTTQHSDLVKPNNLYLAATAYYQLKQQDKALQYAEQAVTAGQADIAAGKAKPNNSHYQMLAALYIQQQRWSDAETVLKGVLEFDATNKSMLRQLSGVYLQGRQYQEAKLLLQQLVAQGHDPNDEKQLATVEAKLAH